MSWNSRIIGSDMVDPSILCPNPKNFRKHPDKQINAMNKVLSGVGWVQEVIVNKTTGHILDGHLRVKLAIDQNESEIPVKWVEISEDEENLILSTYDSITSLAEIDSDMLSGLINELSIDDELVDDIFSQFNLGDSFNGDTQDIVDNVVKPVDIKSTFEIIISCESESEQEDIYQSLVNEGYTCRVLTL